MLRNKSPPKSKSRGGDGVYFPIQINWELLKRFNVVANSYSFVEAARKIGTSPSALLIQMDTLEKEVGYLLFKRVSKNRSKILTPEGELLKEATQHIFLFLSIPLSEQAKQSREKARVLRVITTAGLAKSILYGHLQDFLELNPGLVLELITSASPYMIEPGEVVIRGDFLEQKNVKREYLLSNYFKLCASKEYLDKFGIPKNPLDLVNHRILVHSNKAAMDPSLQWKEDLNIHVTPFIVSDSFDFLTKACQMGAGILEVSDLYFKDSGLIEVLPELSSDRSDIYIAYNKKSAHEQLIPEFVTFLKDRIEGTKKSPKPKKEKGKRIGRPPKDG